VFIEADARGRHGHAAQFTLSWPGLSRPSRLGGHGGAFLIGIAGTSPATTSCWRKRASRVAHPNETLDLSRPHAEETAEAQAKAGVSKHGAAPSFETHCFAMLLRMRRGGAARKACSAVLATARRTAPYDLNDWWIALRQSPLLAGYREPLVAFRGGILAPSASDRLVSKNLERNIIIHISGIIIGPTRWAFNI
jgi:hypothetical protein